MTEVDIIETKSYTVYFVKGTGLLHREDGPALELTDGRKEWFIKGKRHRGDGPALILADGRIFWYLNNICFDKKEEWFEALTEEQKEKVLYSEYFIRD
jgi:hypothetical protein